MLRPMTQSELNEQPMTEPLSPFGFRDIGAREKVGLVRDVFERVASRYDLMNDVMSFGAHRLWKDAACAKLNPQPGETIIDCAGGTGDIAQRLALLSRAAGKRRGISRGATIHLIDYNEAMITEGIKRGLCEEISWSVGDALALGFPDKSVDAYIISFGIRNVSDVRAALIEAKRVLKPGGRFFCLEFSQPVADLIGSVYEFYSFKIIPTMGQMITQDRDSYQYLVESIKRFPNQEQFKSMIKEAGFHQVHYTNFSGGVCALHTGWA